MPPTKRPSSPIQRPFRTKRVRISYERVPNGFEIIQKVHPRVKREEVAETRREMHVALTGDADRITLPHVSPQLPSAIDEYTQTHEVIFSPPFAKRPANDLLAQCIEDTARQILVHGDHTQEYLYSSDSTNPLLHFLIGGVGVSYFRWVMFCNGSRSVHAKIYPGHLSAYPELFELEGELKIRMLQYLLVLCNTRKSIEDFAFWIMINIKYSEGICESLLKVCCSLNAPSEKKLCVIAVIHKVSVGIVSGGKAMDKNIFIKFVEYIMDHLIAGTLMNADEKVFKELETYYRLWAKNMVFGTMCLEEIRCRLEGSRARR